ncbi:MAG: hypothetical protein PHW19_09935 [Salinivirgaceae bacterium]|nr:hypothetical protein [Salinivirgaceae bacterium]
MPNKEAYDAMLKMGFPVDQSHFDQYDTIENADDLELLFEILEKNRDCNHRAASFTPFTNVANPDFEKIKENNFKAYYYEPYSTTLQRYGRSDKTLELWKTGIENKIFVPEYHGREHLASHLWIEELQNPESIVRKAFDFGYTSVKTENIHPEARGFRATLFFNTQEQKEQANASIADGVNLFESLFGMKPSTFIPPNGPYHPDFDETILKSGIKARVSPYYYAIPDGKGSATYGKHYFNKFNKQGLYVYLRNCAFEPIGNGFPGIESTLNQISMAFLLKKPAIISTHRVNFVGGLSKEKRDFGLKQLDLLLTAIRTKWPDVEFLSTREYVSLFCGKI